MNFYALIADVVIVNIILSIYIGTIQMPPLVWHLFEEM